MIYILMASKNEEEDLKRLDVRSTSMIIKVLAYN